MINIEENYKFRIERVKVGYIAQCFYKNECMGWTQGKDENDIFEMIADFFLTVQDIPCSRWTRFWHGVYNYFIF